MNRYIHYCGPSYPICHFSGKEVLDPKRNPNQLSQYDAIQILMVQDPRRVSRHKDCHEGYSFSLRK